MHDIDKMRESVSLPDEAARAGLKLEQDGHEFICCCPFHGEDTPSFTIYPGKDRVWRFFCFGCKERGDVIDFISKLKGCSIGDAIRIIAGDLNMPNREPVKVAKGRNVYEGIEVLPKPPAALYAKRPVTVYNPKRAGMKTKDGRPRDWNKFSPSMVFPYFKADGSFFGYVVRHELHDGGKETPMLMYVRLKDGTETWCRYPFPKPRPLYGLRGINDSTKQVFVVEGEKCRDALRKISDGRRCIVSWCGGSYGVEHTDWSPVFGLDVIIWPDNDMPGLGTANKIAEIVAKGGAKPRILSTVGYAS